MTKQTYELRVAATADIIEIWRIEAESARAARELFEDGDTSTFSFVENTEIDNERDREILECEPVAVGSRSQPLNRFQRVVADNYGGGDFAHIEGQAAAKTDDQGDTLFTFLLRELDDDCQDDIGEALRRLRGAIDDLAQVERAISSLQPAA